MGYFDFCTVFACPTTIYLPFVVGTFLMCGGPENTEPGKNLMSVFISSFEALVMQRKNIKHKSIALLISSMLKEKQSSMGQHFSKMLRDWSKSIRGGGGGPEHLEMWLIKNT